MWPICGSQIGNVSSEASWGPIMECQDATAHIGGLSSGISLVEELEDASNPCGGVRCMPQQADGRGRGSSWDESLLGWVRTRFDTVLAGYRMGSAAVHETFARFLDAPLAVSPRGRVPECAVADSLPIEPFERNRWRRRTPALAMAFKSRHGRASRSVREL